jgi:superfamily I DNA/RNA helicase
VRPEKILITAFNVDAARSVKEKLSELVSERASKSLTVNNIDKLSKLWVSSTKKFHMDTLNVREYTAKLVSIMQTDSSFLSRITNQFDYIFFDEFQDINPEEYELLKLFAAHSTVITFVGDDA